MKCTPDCVARQICATCNRRKAPLGRSVPTEMGSMLCDHDCPGYQLAPKPGHLWPGEDTES